MSLEFTTSYARKKTAEQFAANPDLAKKTYTYQLADEVDRLRAALTEIALLGDVRADEAGNIARRALGQKC